MTNLPANRLWSTVTFHGLGHILFLTKYIRDVPGPEDLVARIISQAAQGESWTFHAKDWIERVCNERLAANKQKPDTMRRMKAWQNQAGVKEWLRQSVSADAMRSISFIARAIMGVDPRAGDNITGVEVTLPLPLAVAVKIW
eukprot:7418707-Heterocapsa_arctica.AAC.1